MLPPEMDDVRLLSLVDDVKLELEPLDAPPSPAADDVSDALDVVEDCEEEEVWPPPPPTPPPPSDPLAVVLRRLPKTKWYDRYSDRSLDTKSGAEVTGTASRQDGTDGMTRIYAQASFVGANSVQLPSDATFENHSCPS